METITPQVWGSKELAAHYPAWGDKRLKREIARRVGLRFHRGQRVAVDRSDVDEIDRQLSEEAKARRASVAPTGSAKRVRTATLKQFVADFRKGA